jgi:SAM-dependent methyltransferase
MNTEKIRGLLQFPLYQPIEHPEFAGEAVQPCEERLKLILDALPGAVLHPPNPGRRFMVDFGCHTGWFCRAFSRLGWLTVGFDRSPEWLEAASLLNELTEGPKPRYILADVLSVFDLQTDREPVCDVALCLSVAMYLFEDPAKGWKFFKNVSESAQRMFFDFGGMYSARVPFNEEELPGLMLKHTAFQSWRKIGASNLERSLFLFER